MLLNQGLSFIVGLGHLGKVVAHGHLEALLLQLLLECCHLLLDRWLAREEVLLGLEWIHLVGRLLEAGLLLEEVLLGLGLQGLLDICKLLLLLFLISLQILFLLADCELLEKMHHFVLKDGLHLGLNLVVYESFNFLLFF